MPPDDIFPGPYIFDPPNIESQRNTFLGNLYGAIETLDPSGAMSKGLDTNPNKDFQGGRNAGKFVAGVAELWGAFQAASFAGPMLGGGAATAVGVIGFGLAGVLVVLGVVAIGGVIVSLSKGGRAGPNGANKQSKPIRTPKPETLSKGPKTQGTKDDYGSTELSKAVQKERIDRNDKGHNYASARLDDGEIIVKASDENAHSEIYLLDEAKARGRSIVEIYSEREPCASGCAPEITGIKTSWSWDWNETMQSETRKQINQAVRLLFKK